MPRLYYNLGSVCFAEKDLFRKYFPKISLISRNNLSMKKVFIIKKILCLKIFVDDEVIFRSFISISNTNNYFLGKYLQVIHFPREKCTLKLAPRNDMIFLFIFLVFGLQMSNLWEEPNSSW